MPRVVVSVASQTSLAAKPQKKHAMFSPTGKGPHGFVLLPKWIDGRPVGHECAGTGDLSLCGRAVKSGKANRSGLAGYGARVQSRCQNAKYIAISSRLFWSCPSSA